MKLSQYFVISCLIGIISPIMMATEERVVTLEGGEGRAREDRRAVREDALVHRRREDPRLLRHRYNLDTPNNHIRDILHCRSKNHFHHNYNKHSNLPD